MAGRRGDSRPRMSVRRLAPEGSPHAPGLATQHDKCRMHELLLRQWRWGLVK